MSKTKSPRISWHPAADRQHIGVVNELHIFTVEFIEPGHYALTPHFPCSDEPLYCQDLPTCFAVADKLLIRFIAALLNTTEQEQ